MSAQKDNSSNLFEYSDDWQKKFLAPEVVLTKYNFKLIANLQGQGIFTFPLFSKNFCNQLIKKLKKFDNWTTNRHEHYPTNDVLIEDFDMEFAKMYNTVLCDILLTAVHDLYEFPYPDPDMFDHETFIIRYKPEFQGHLDLHHDQSSFSTIITLSSEKEYEGGGTYFCKQNLTLKAKQGEVMIHPGILTHRHGVRPIISGERYALVSFCRINLF